MGMLKALAMLGAGASGYTDGAEQFRQKQRQIDADARTKLMQDREDQQYMQAQTDDQAARNAMAPRTVDSAPVAVPIGSRDEPQAPEDRGIRVDGQQYPDQASAQAAADSQSTITARMQRAAGAVQNPLLAAKLSAGAQDAELSGLKLADAKRTARNQKFDDDAHEAIWKGPQATAEFLSSTHADGKGGQVKFQAVTDPATKKWQIVRVADDGALVPFGPQYTDDDSGKVQALYQLSKAVSPADKEKHMLEQSRLTRQEKRDADLNASTIEHNRILGKYYEGLIDAKFDKNDIDANKPGKATVDKMSPDDKAEYLDLHEKSKKLDGDMTKGRLDASAMKTPFDAKDPTLAPLFEQQSILAIKMKKLLDKYRTKDAPANADPRGILGPTKVTPATQAERDKDRPTVLAAEFKAANADDRVALQREIDRLPADLRAKAKSLIDGNATTAPAAPAPAAAAKKTVGDRLTGTTIAEIQQQLAAGGGPMDQATTSTPAAPAASTLPTGLQPTGDKVMNAILSTKMAAIKPLNEALKSAQAALAAAAKSGDPKAVQRYTDEVVKASAARNKAAKEMFGNSADDYLKTV